MPSNDVGDFKPPTPPPPRLLDIRMHHANGELTELETLGYIPKRIVRELHLMTVLAAPVVMRALLEKESGDRFDELFYDDASGWTAEDLVWDFDNNKRGPLVTILEETTGLPLEQVSIALSSWIEKEDSGRGGSQTGSTQGNQGGFTGKATTNTNGD